MTQIGAPSAIDRIVEVLAGRPSTEAELRTVRAEAGGWTLVLTGRVGAHERRLGELTAEPTSSLAAIADELRQVEALRRQLSETRALIDRLDERARDLRSAWMSAQPNLPHR